MSTRTEKVEIYFSRVEWRWRYRATNGRVLADGAEGYTARADAVRGALRVTGLPGTPRAVTFRGGHLYWYWAAADTNRAYDVELVQR